MEDYVIRRDRLKLFGCFLALGVLSVLSSLMTQAAFESVERASFLYWFWVLAIAFTAAGCIVGTLFFCYELVFAPSEMLRLTREGFYYSGPEVGLRVCYFSWQDVDWVFYHEVEFRRRHQVKYNRFICMDFLKPEAVWQQSVGKPLKRANRHPNHGDLNIQLLGTDHTDKEIRDLINLMNVYREQASRT